MNVISVQLPNAKYPKLPVEDSFKVHDNIFVVADGITRDTIGFPDYSKLTPELLVDNYPVPSPAKSASQLFCDSFIIKLLKSKDRISELEVRKAFIYGNKQIRELNKINNPVPDYLEKDYWGCVACGGVIENNFLYWANIGDCCISVFDKNGNNYFNSPNGLSNFTQYIIPPEYNFSKPEGRVFVRKEIRNKIKIEDNKNVGYGALTGEKEAEFFIFFGKLKLHKGDMIVFYSDGFEDTIKHQMFFNNTYQQTQKDINNNFIQFSDDLAKIDLNKYGRERTLVFIKI